MCGFIFKECMVTDMLLAGAENVVGAHVVLYENSRHEYLL